MTGDLHQKLVERGARWLKRKGFGVVATEITVAGIAEQSDAIGFRGQCSAVLEAKATRSDFLADRKKTHRTSGGLGTYRFFICPHALILPEDLPPRWGLLWVLRRKVEMIVGPTGNWWPAHEAPAARESQWAAFWHPSDPEAERKVLYSIARRAQAVESRHHRNARVGAGQRRRENDHWLVSGS